MGFAFLPLGIGAFVAGRIGGALLHYFGEVQHQPQRFWWAITAISAWHDYAAAVGCTIVSSSRRIGEVNLPRHRSPVNFRPFPA